MTPGSNTTLSRVATLVEPEPSTQARLRVDGKFLARGQRRIRLHGVTYGPFAANDRGEPFPSPEQTRTDLRRMRAADINALRTYHVPPEWFFDAAAESAMFAFVDVPWGKHTCFLDSAAVQREARENVRNAARAAHGCPALAALSIGNEIPADIVRWHGSRKVERFLRELADVARQTDPDCLVTYGNFPPTEYLDPSFADFITFNVYLHERETFRRYLFRLQNLVGDKPLVLGELGMDTLRHGELAQADFLAGHIREARLMGLAGFFVFSWTDDWHTGGHQIEDWAFGITRADRSPKAAYHALREVLEAPVEALLPQAPPVSVVVCSYNGGRTLDQCLRSLLNLDYPDYEIIVVNDGSTDNTEAILEHYPQAQYPRVRVIHQTQQGLSVARNVGLHAARGDIIAYTDSDCFADPDWLTHLVYELERSGAAAVGGPNFTPDDGWLAACVAASPGQPTHVLESDQVAEHIPGCNMAFRRQALLAINGFDPQFHRAGDDVDICWRLQQAGQWITFAPAAFVWHHRRQGPRSYFRQQAGYGEAEGLLRFQHPERFNHRGDGKWRGVLYGNALQGLRLGQPIIYHGTFGTGLFQCVYQPGPAHWAMIPSTLEWHAAAALIGLSGFLWPWAWLVAAGMIGLSFLVAALQAAQARLPKGYHGISARLVIAGLCYLQPLIRSWQRYRTRWFSFRLPARNGPIASEGRRRFPLRGKVRLAYWTDQGRDRTELLQVLLAHLGERRWGKVIDSGWATWDLQLDCDRWTLLSIRTAEENLGGQDRQIRLCLSVGLRGGTRILGLGMLGVAATAACWQLWLGGALAGIGAAFFVGLWARSLHLAVPALEVVDAAAQELRLIPVKPAPHAPHRLPTGDTHSTDDIVPQVHHLAGEP